MERGREDTQIEIKRRKEKKQMTQRNKKKIRQK